MALNAVEALSLAGQIAFAVVVLLRLPGASGAPSSPFFDGLAIAAQAPFCIAWIFVLADTVVCGGAMGRGVYEWSRTVRADLWVVDPALAAQAAAVLAEAAKGDPETTASRAVPAKAGSGAEDSTSSGSDGGSGDEGSDDTASGADEGSDGEASGADGGDA